MKYIFNRVFNQINVITLIIFIECNSYTMWQPQPTQAPGGAVRTTGYMAPKPAITQQHILLSKKVLHNARENLANLVFQELQQRDLTPEQTAKTIYAILFSQILKQEDIVKLLTLALPIFSQMPEQDQQALNFFRVQINVMPKGQPIDVNYQFGHKVEDSLLFRAASAGDLYTTTILKNLGADIFRMYRAKGALNPNAPTIWPSHMGDDRTIITTLLNAGYNPNILLYLTVKCLQFYGRHTGRQEHVEKIVRILINYPQIDINFRVKKTDGTFACPPIYYAIITGLFEVVRMMRQKGANMHMRCSYLDQEHKDTPLELFKRLRTGPVNWYSPHVATEMEKALTVTIDKLV